MLAIEYLLSQPGGIKSAILGSAMISMPLYQAEVEELKKELPKNAYSIMRKHEKAGTTDSKEYSQAMKHYNKRHIYRRGTFPKKFNTPKGTFGTVPYETLWGVSEAYANGSLKTWDRIKRLKEIKAPTLITSGQYDELTPHQAVITHDNIPGSRLRIFTAGSHCVHVELQVEYVETVNTFLHQVEKSEPRSSQP